MFQKNLLKIKHSEFIIHEILYVWEPKSKQIFISRTKIQILFFKKLPYNKGSLKYNFRKMTMIRI